MARKGNALVGKDEFEEGLELLKSANREYFDSKVKFRIRDLEKLKKKREEEAYINPELAEEHNAKGNDLFKAGKFVEAIPEYDEAIKRNPHLAKLYSNRAAVFIKLIDPARALTDINKCLELDPNFIRGHARKG
eukprot:CAMPEP_0168316730 /NCGR_PEP_ID=MMETSP0210-20121227/18619_1 /TAXON_ID=40633 /ORGANISM="Condylostoma magnum, Strain COL2" /LENGTH=133 /DNA_ID=CAMNT_0008303351 /DNA_START=894 /DNA_END=1295 /DNA_ORIENTATION=-